MIPSPSNPTGLDGIDFIEFAGPDPDTLHRLFLAFGFSRLARHQTRAIDLYQQGDITFLLDRDRTSFAARFVGLHGPSICSMGWRVTGDAARSRDIAVARGATPCLPGEGDLEDASGQPVPAVRGIGDSLIYFMDAPTPPQAMGPSRVEALGFVPLPEPDRVRPLGFRAIDHLTNNVAKGTMSLWTRFYKTVFGFTEVRYFDIRGARTGLTSHALRSPCGRFCIPINEASEQKSQINEYLEEYNGPGIQHLAFLTDDILASLRGLDGSPIQFLDMDEEYYSQVWTRVPGVREDRAEIRRRQVLVDGDADGYLLQIFTRNLVGPIFIELIQRNNHLSFGEGNFSALFRSIERDQQRRGVFDREGAGATRSGAD